MRLSHFRSAFVLIGLSLMTTGCAEEGGRLVVELQTDLLPAREFTEVQVSLDGRDEVRSEVSVSQRFGEGEAVAEFQGQQSGRGRLVVELLDEDGDRVVERELVFDLRENLTVRARVARACRYVECDGGETCVSGACVASDCVKGDEPSCPEPECRRDRDCDASSTCAEGLCDGGSCFYVAEEASCEGDAFCVPESGCLLSVPLCSDGEINEGETGVDCGGPCAPCAEEPTCDDGVSNGDETDVDCGGDCGPCDDGDACERDRDCESDVCERDECAEPSCDDDEENGDEEGVDCGGECEPCEVEARCDDEELNGDETDVDCGGECDPCSDDASCDEANDCVSGVCDDNTCMAPSCADGIANGDETDLDCGGSCESCAAGSSCEEASDCMPGVCADEMCAEPTCDDGVQNDAETGVDCGGDCDSCLPPSCSDGDMNNDETDVDCGGSCDPCALGASCRDDVDCTTASCSGGVCLAAHCGDGMENGDETALDCGGACGASCGTGISCAVPDDCVSGVCTSNICAAPTCFDGVQNGFERDGIDCGGPMCMACGPGLDDTACDDTLMSVDSCTGFETAATRVAPWEFAPGSLPATYSVGTVYRGEMSYVAVHEGTSFGERRYPFVIPAGGVGPNLRFYMHIEAPPEQPVDIANIGAVETGLGGADFNLVLTTSGRLSASYQGTDVGDLPVPLGRWFCVALNVVTRSLTTGVLRMSADGSNRTKIVGDTLVPWAIAAIGAHNTASSFDYEVAFDEVAFDFEPISCD